MIYAHNEAEFVAKFIDGLRLRCPAFPYHLRQLFFQELCTPPALLLPRPRWLRQYQYRRLWRRHHHKDGRGNISTSFGTEVGPRSGASYQLSVTSLARRWFRRGTALSRF